MEVYYFYCNSCGYEVFDEFIAYSRATANGEWLICPECGKESNNFDTGED